MVLLSRLFVKHRVILWLIRSTLRTALKSHVSALARLRFGNEYAYIRLDFCFVTSNLKLTLGGGI
jgi:hypothetical protein